MRTTITERDGPVWEDNTLELFLTHPDMGASYFHFIVNAAGTVYDRRVDASEKGDKSFNSSLEVKTHVLADRWVLEIRIPTAELGEKCFLGQSWKINVLRTRCTRDRKDDYLLACAVVGQAEYLVTGDNDLLVLDGIEGIRIVTARKFCEIVRAG